MRVDSRKFLSVGVLVLLSTLAVNGATSKEAAIVKDVSFSNNGDSLEAKITASDETKYTYFELQQPRRLVIDFRGIQNTISFKERRIDAAGVERVRTSLFSDKSRKATRIVFDLNRDVRYRLIEDGGGVVRIVFGDNARAPENQTAGPVIVPANAPKPPLSQALLAMIPVSEPEAPSIPERLPSVRLQSPLLTPEITVPAAVPPAPPAPVVTAEPLAASAPVAAAPATKIPTVTVRPTPAPTQAQAPSPVMAAADSSLFPQTQVTVVPPTAPQVPTNPTPIPQYTGELVSLDLRDVNVKDFFALISELSGLNVVLDPNVNGTVTLRLTDVPWDQALDVVLKNYQLGGQLQGNVLRIATNSTLQQEQQNQKALRDAQDLAAPLDTRTFILNYTKAAEVSTTLKNLTSTRGQIIVDARRNALIIKDIPSQFTNLESMVKFLDTPAQQVEIQARLLQANKSFSRDIGNQLGLLIGNQSGNILTGLPGQVSPFQRTPPPRASTGSGLPLLANFPAAASAGLSFLIQPGGDVLLDEIIGAAEARGTARLISRPTVTTMNNTPATIQQGTQIPVQTNVNNTITVQFTSFALQLQVTPQIAEAGTILLTVNITNSQPDFARAVNGIPSVASQSAQTQVLVQDGGTAVIGGILVDTDTINVRQVPGLGNLPLIGNLFKETNTAKSTAELLFFVTPRIKPMDAISVLSPGVDLTPVPQQR
jgi:type IV pilus assembly protein PilQ